jgi:hypothetical protein
MKYISFSHCLTLSESWINSTQEYMAIKENGGTYAQIDVHHYSLWSQVSNGCNTRKGRPLHRLNWSGIPCHQANMDVLIRRALVQMPTSHHDMENAWTHLPSFQRTLCTGLHMYFYVRSKPERTSNIIHTNPYSSAHYHNLSLFKHYKKWGSSID